MNFCTTGPGILRCVAFATFLTLELIFSSKGMAQAANLEIDHFGIEQGLSHRNVQCLLKDDKQFLWVGTQYGLNRFDGKRFQHYLPDPKNPHSISGLSILSLHQSRDRKIWCCLRDGKIDALHLDSGKFQHFELPNTPAGVRPQIQMISEFVNGDIYVGTKMGHIYCKSASDIQFQYRTSISQNKQFARTDEFGDLIVSISETTKGTAWIVTKVGQWKWHFDDPDAVPEAIDSHLKKGLHEFMLPMDNNCWVLGSLTRLEMRDSLGLLLRRIQTDRHAHAAYQLHKQNQFSSGFHYDRKSNAIWVPFFQHQKLLSLDIHSLELHTTEVDVSRFLRPGFDFRIASFLEHEEGLVWMASNYGLFCIKRPPPSFPAPQNVEDSLLRHLNLSVRGIARDRQGKLWVAADPKGLFEMDTLHKRWIHHAAVPGQSGKLQDQTIWAAHCDQENNLWIGGNQLYKRDEARQRFIPLHELLNLEAPIEIGVHALASDPTYGLWIGGERGLYRLPPGAKSLELISPAYKVYALFLYEDGSILIGTETHGLLRYQPESKEWNFPWLDGVYVNDIRTIYCDRAGRIWLGTAGSGLVQLQLSKAGDWGSAPIFEQFSTQDGLPNNVIYGILEEGKPGAAPGHLWLSTNYGLARFDPENKTITNFTEKHGLLDNEFNTQSWFKDKNGGMYFGGLHGVMSFLPAQISRPEPGQSVQITRILVDHKPLDLPDPLPEGTKLEFDYDHNNLSFEFVAPQFQEPSKIKYAYRMDGLDEHWHDLQHENTIHFARIPPGKYAFRVRASNQEGEWGGKETRISFLVHQAWWNSSMAIVGYISVGLLFLGFLWRIQVNRIKMRNELSNQRKEALRMKELGEFKSQFFTNITHEFRTPLLLILGPIDFLKSQLRNQQGKEMVRMLERNSKRLLQLINHLLDLASLDAKKRPLNLVERNLGDLVRAQLAQFQNLANDKQIRLGFSDMLPFQTTRLDQEKMELILGNVIGNALKFTPAGGTVEVSTSFQETQNTILISISDSGCGIAPSQIPKLFERFYRADTIDGRKQQGSGLGLSLVKELVDLHKGRIVIESELEKGTRVDIFLPYMPNNQGELEQSLLQSASALENPTNELAPKADFLSGQGPHADKLLVLLIEDNEDVRQYIRFHLAPLYRLLEAKDGESGLNMAIESVPDLIISDVMMPGMDGLEVARRLKLAESTSHIPVILLTAKVGLENKLAGLETGADNYLEKPFLMRELHLRIRNLIAIRKNLHQRYAAQAKPQNQPPPDLLSKEDQFLIRIRELVEEHLSEEGYSIGALASDASISRGQLHRKLKALTGMSPSVFMRVVRLERAHLLLTHNSATVSEISWQVGFSSHAYFSKCFTEHFSYPPSAIPRHS